MGARSLRGSRQGVRIQEGGGPRSPGWGYPPPEQPAQSPFLNQPQPDSAPFSHHHLRVASRLSLSGYSGSAGPQSSLALEGTNFSTRDADNDNCLCKCAQMLSGGGCGVRGSPSTHRWETGDPLRHRARDRWRPRETPELAQRQSGGNREPHRGRSTKERWREKCKSGQEKGTQCVRDRERQKGREGGHQREEPGLRETHRQTQRPSERKRQPQGVGDSGDRDHCPHREREMGLVRE